MHASRISVFASLLFLIGHLSFPAKVDASEPQASLFADLEKSEFIAEGPKVAKNQIYVFFDPNCLYCNLTWKALQPYEKAGLQVRWVPVAFQKTSSTGRAAAILEARYREAALRYNETKYDANRYEGGITPLDQPKADTLRKIQTNTALMERFGASGTPAMVWKDRGGIIHIKSGMPRLSEIPAITGLPEQKITDGELSQFR